MLKSAYGSLALNKDEEKGPTKGAISKYGISPFGTSNGGGVSDNGFQVPVISLPVRKTAFALKA